METVLRAAVLDWLQTDPMLVRELNIIAEEAPSTASAPWLGLVASASVDWSTKTRKGREVRVALELHTRGDDPIAGAELVQAIEMRLEHLPRQQSHFLLASVTFLRARSEQRSGNRRATLLEYRFRILEPETLTKGTTQ